MTRRILVPLDGSQLSEAALGPARAFAIAWEASVTLLHIIEQDAPVEKHGERHLTRPEEAEAYLSEIASQGLPASVQVETHVHTAPVADVPRSIVDHVTEFEPDLIVMCTHGRGGVGRLVYGSVAQQVVGQGSSPLLLVKPEASPPPFELERILLPLDPESGHDEGLPVGRDIALAFQAELFLLSVTHSAATMPGEQAAAGTFMPATAQAFLDIREENTRAHLQEHVNSLRAEGLEAAAGVLRGDAAGAILSAAGALDVDLIILCTHGRAGLSAFWARSVAPTVAQRAGVPILLIPLA